VHVFGLTKRMLIVIGLVVLVAVLLIVQNNKKGSAQQGGTSSGACQVQVTADVLNVRSGPDDTANVVGKLATGAITGAQTKIQNGYRELGANRWASSQFLKPVSGSC
jgi:competence protein ComGC